MSQELIATYEQLMEATLKQISNLQKKNIITKDGANAVYAQLASQAMAQAVQYEQVKMSEGVSKAQEELLKKQTDSETAREELLKQQKISEQAKVKNGVDGNNIEGSIGKQNKVLEMQAMAFAADMANKLYSTNVAAFNVDLSKGGGIGRTSQAKNDDVQIGLDHDAVKGVITDMLDKLDQ